MIDLPELPTFDVPEYHHKKQSNEIIYEWIAENVRNLKKSNQIDRLRKQESRQPVDVRFVL